MCLNLALTSRGLAPRSQHPTCWCISIRSHPGRSLLTHKQSTQRHLPCSAIAGTSGEGGEEPPDGDIARARQQLSRMMESPSLTGLELRQLVFEKWGRSYDVCIAKRGNRWFLQVMWRHLEQQSFPLSKEQYQEQLDAVAEMVALWGVSDAVRAGIAAGRPRGPGFTAGGSARAVSIPLPVDSATARRQEWDTSP